MTEQNKLDLNINNWSLDSLYELFNIPKDATTDNVAKTTDDVIQKQTSGELKYFLQLARNKIIKEQQLKLEGFAYTEDTDTQLKSWWKNQFLTSGDANQADKATIRTNKVEIFDDENGHYQMKQNRLGVNQSHNLPHVQGTINPNLKTQVERVVIVDSQYRTNIFPWAAKDQTKPSFNTDFTITLSEQLSNVTEITMESVNIPKSWYNFSSFIGNTCFEVQGIDSSGQLQEPPSLIYIPDGNYEMNDLMTHLNNIAFDVSTNPIDLSFNYDSITNKCSFSCNISDNSLNGYRITFFKPGGFLDVSGECHFCTTTSFSNNNFGWSTGWRITPDASGVVSFDILNQKKIKAHAVPQIESISSLIIILDDYNKNRLNTGIIGASQQNTKLSFPSYRNETVADLSSCLQVNDKKIQFYTKVAPRKLTQAQIYTINSIMIDRLKSKQRNTAPTTSDALCVIPISSAIENNENIVLMSNQLSTNKREYFGPVDIERLRARLTDDNGNIVNLNGRDWSFTLRVKQLYQY
jgi:hypothetical protein